MKKRPWTDAEVDDLCANYGRELAASIGSRMGRSYPAISLKAQALGLGAKARPSTKWTSDMVDTLRTMYSTTSARQIGESIGVHVFNVKQKIKRLKLSKAQSVSTSWTQEQDNQLRATYKKIGAKRLSAIMGKTTTAIYVRAHHLGLSTKSTKMKMARIPIGGERLNSKGLLVRKIADTGNQHNDYKRVDVIDWEAVNGLIPNGYTLMIINKYLPRTLSNLQLIKKDEVLATVSGVNLPPEVRELLTLQRQIERQAKGKAKK